MQQKEDHFIQVIDFIFIHSNSIFVKITGYDAILGKEFEGEVKFLNGMPFGDLIHSERSSLSPECREFVRENLLRKYLQGHFD